MSAYLAAGLLITFSVALVVNGKTWFNQGRKEGWQEGYDAAVDSMDRDIKRGQSK